MKVANRIADTKGGNVGSSSVRDHTANFASACLIVFCFLGFVCCLIDESGQIKPPVSSDTGATIEAKILEQGGGFIRRPEKDGDKSPFVLLLVVDNNSRFHGLLGKAVREVAEFWEGEEICLSVGQPKLTKGNLVQKFVFYLKINSTTARRQVLPLTI